MKKYKVVTNWFRDFDKGNILWEAMAPGKLSEYYMSIKNGVYYPETKTMPAKFVENYPEYFEEIPIHKTKSTIEQIKDLCRDSEDIKDWSARVSFLDHTIHLINIQT